MIKNCEGVSIAILLQGSDGGSRTRLCFLGGWKRRPLEFCQYRLLRDETALLSKGLIPFLQKQQEYLHFFLSQVFSSKLSLSLQIY